MGELPDRFGTYRTSITVLVLPLPPVAVRLPLGRCITARLAIDRVRRPRRCRTVRPGGPTAACGFRAAATAVPVAAAAAAPLVCFDGERGDGRTGSVVATGERTGETDGGAAGLGVAAEQRRRRASSLFGVPTIVAGVTAGGWAVGARRQERATADVRAIRARSGTTGTGVVCRRCTAVGEGSAVDRRLATTVANCGVALREDWTGAHGGRAGCCTTLTTPPLPMPALRLLFEPLLLWRVVARSARASASVAANAGVDASSWTRGGREGTDVRGGAPVLCVALRGSV